MICHRIGGALLCRGVSRKARCAAGGECRRRHTRLCDFPDPVTQRRCSLKLCATHATRDDEGRDLCPFHARQLRLFTATVWSPQLARSRRAERPARAPTQGPLYRFGRSARRA
jgi:hypothetical protein